jgi:hypothetical protein
VAAGGAAGAGAGWLIVGALGIAAGADSETQEAPRRAVPAGQLVGATIPFAAGGALTVGAFLRADCARRCFSPGVSCL